MPQGLLFLQHKQPGLYSFTNLGLSPVSGYVTLGKGPTPSQTACLSDEDGACSRAIERLQEQCWPSSWPSPVSYRRHRRIPSSLLLHLLPWALSWRQGIRGLAELGGASGEPQEALFSFLLIGSGLPPQLQFLLLKKKKNQFSVSSHLVDHLAQATAVAGAGVALGTLGLLMMFQASSLWPEVWLATRK